MVGLRAINFSFFNRERISRSAVACPRGEVKVPAGRNSINADFLKSERLTLFASLGLVHGPKKVRALPASQHGSFAIGLNQHRRLFVNRNFARRFRPSILYDASEEDQSSAHAVTLREVRIGQQILQVRNLEKTANQGYALGVRIGQNIGRNEGPAVRRVSESAVDKFAQHGEAGAGTTDRLALGEIGIDRILNRCVFPGADVVRLIAAGNKYDLCLANDFGHGWILCGLTIGKNERGHRVQLAQSVDVGVVRVAPARTEDEEVTAVALLAKPIKGLVQIAPAPNHGNAGIWLVLDIVFFSDARLLKRAGMSETSRQQ